MKKLSHLFLIVLLVLSTVVTSAGTALAAPGDIQVNFSDSTNELQTTLSVPITVEETGTYTITGSLMDPTKYGTVFYIMQKNSSGNFIYQGAFSTALPSSFTFTSAGSYYVLTQVGVDYGTTNPDSLTFSPADVTINLTSDTTNHAFENALFQGYNSSSHYHNVSLTKPVNTVVENITKTFDMGANSPFQVIYDNASMTTPENTTGGFQVIPKGNLSVGMHTDTLRVKGDNTNEVVMSFTITIFPQAAPTLGVDPTSHDFGEIREGYGLTQQQFSVQKQGHPSTVITGLAATFEKGTAFTIPTIDPNWLGSGTSSGALLVKVSPNLAAGIYTDTLTITADNQQPVTITLSVEIIETHEITFMNEDVIVDTYDIDAGQTISPLPADPSKVGHTFKGWFTKTSGEFDDSAYDFDTAPTSDVILYAKFDENSYVVSFDKGDGSEITNVTINYNGTVTEPEPPVRENYSFGGWYTEGSFVNAYDFNTAVTSDFTLYAKWLGSDASFTLVEGSTLVLNSDTNVISNIPFEYTIISLFMNLEANQETYHSISYFRADGTEIFTFEMEDQEVYDESILYTFVKDGDYFTIVSEDQQNSETYTFYTNEAAVNDTYSTPIATELVVNAENGVLSNDSLEENYFMPFGTMVQADMPESGHSVEIVTQPRNGTLLMNDDGSFTYTPTTSAYGTDTFKYRIRYELPFMMPVDVGAQGAMPMDNVAYSNTATVTLNIGSTPPPLPAPSGEILVVDDENPSIILVRLLVQRSIENGMNIDSVLMEYSRVLQALEALDEDTSRVIIPELAGNPITRIALPTESVNLYEEFNKDLMFQLPYLNMYLTGTDLAGTQGEFTLSFQQLVDSASRQSAMDEMMKLLDEGQSVRQIVNHPVQVTTNQDLTDIQLSMPLPVNFPAADIEKLKIFVQHSDGTTEWLDVRVEGNQVFFTTPSFSIFTLVVLDEEATMGDDLPYILGFEDQTFRPGEAVTRQQIAAMFARRLSQNTIPVMSGTPFKDISTVWAKNEIEYVRSAGIMTGITEDMFNPGGTMTRSQMAVVADRWLTKVCAESSTASSYCDQTIKGAGYADIASTQWSADSVIRMQGLGIMKGYEDGTFRGYEVVTRAQVVTIINRLFELMPAASYEVRSFRDVSSSHWAYRDIERATKGQ